MCASQLLCDECGTTQVRAARGPVGPVQLQRSCRTAAAAGAGARSLPERRLPRLHAPRHSWIICSSNAEVRQSPAPGHGCSIAVSCRTIQSIFVARQLDSMCSGCSAHQAPKSYDRLAASRALHEAALAYSVTHLSPPCCADTCSVSRPSPRTRHDSIGRWSLKTWSSSGTPISASTCCESPCALTKTVP